VHAIKIMASGGIISPSDPLRVPQYSPEEIRAVADLLVLDGDPLRDPSLLWGGPDRRAVFQGGTRVADQAARLVL
jgi:imidazolonepropionase-like amidohydrolase